MAALDIAFPSPFRSLAESFGIDVRKPAELVHYCREESGAHYTGGWFHVVGRISAGSDGWKPFGENSWVPNFEPYEGGVEVGFTNRLALVPRSFDGHSVVQFEFTTRVPWVISAPESE